MINCGTAALGCSFVEQARAPTPHFQEFFTVTAHGLSATTKHENVSRRDAKIAKREGGAAALGGSLDKPAFGRFIRTGWKPAPL
jgi:hypothetical protein